MSIPREIICAGAHLVAKYINVPPSSTDAAIMAKGLLELLAEALPHLAPKPPGSDEERAEEIARAFTPVDMGGTVKARTERILAFVSAVRAEERAAQATQIAALTGERDRQYEANATMIAKHGAEVAALLEALRKLPQLILAERAADAINLIDAALEMSGGVGR